MWGPNQNLEALEMARESETLLLPEHLLKRCIPIYIESLPRLFQCLRAGSRFFPLGYGISKNVA